MQRILIIDDEPHILLMLKTMLKTIREMKRMQSEVKIIAMSGGGKTSAENFLETAKIFGASKIVEKPFSQQQMVTAVQELLGTDSD